MLHKFDPSWGSHIVPLIKALAQTNGDVLELGLGISSTPVLHALCEDQNRYLLSLENDPLFTEGFKKYRTQNHEIQLVDDWSKVVPNFWSVILVDSKPEASRVELIKKFATWAKFIIIHDSEPDKENLYHYSEIYPLFKYRTNYTKNKIYTTVLSNFHDLD